MLRVLWDGFGPPDILYLHYIQHLPEQESILLQHVHTRQGPNVFGATRLQHSYEPDLALHTHQDDVACIWDGFGPPGILYLHYIQHLPEQRSVLLQHVHTRQGPNVFGVTRLQHSHVPASCITYSPGRCCVYFGMALGRHGILYLPYIPAHYRCFEMSHKYIATPLSLHPTYRLSTHSVGRPKAGGDARSV